MNKTISKHKRMKITSKQKQTKITSKTNNEDNYIKNKNGKPNIVASCNL